MKNIEAAKKYEEYIISQRRYFHENPELPGKETNTVQKISEELRGMGIPFVEIENGGILATVKGGKAGEKAVLLRADIDALAIEEAHSNLKNERTCISKNKGIMHACGHDGHTAMLLGAAKILLEKQADIEGTVYLCFERAEEGGYGHRYIIEYIDKNKINIDSVYAMHLYSGLDSGKLAINDGAMMACNMHFDITIEGKGGHGCRPDLSINPINAFVEICNGLGAVRMRKIDPFKPLAYSIGMVKSGTSRNVIPDTLSFSGTVRTFDRSGSGMVFRREMKNLIDGICDIHGCKAIYNNFLVPNLAVVNDKECAIFARDVIGKEIGREDVITADPWMASEPFSCYISMWPGVFAFLGIKNEEKGTGAEHHNSYFDIDESVLYKGSAAAATYALEFLKSDIDTSSRKLKGGFNELMNILNDPKESLI